MTRLPLLTPELLDHDQRGLYESIAGGRRAGGPQHFRIRHDDGSLTEPFNALLHAPELAAHGSQLGEAVGFETGFSNREREIAILTVAAVRDASYEWYAHERVGRSLGLTEGELEMLRTGERVAFSDEREAVVSAVAATLAAGRALDDDAYGREATVLSERELVELAVLVGYFDLLSTVLDAFAVSVPEGADPFEPEGEA
jgi:alkylhydroperoxidase family enzyme